MLRGQAKQEKCGLILNGFNVCRRTFHLCLGFGKYRVARLRRAVLQGLENSPMDLRMLPQKWTVQPGDSSARSGVHEWLTEMYHKLAEPLPEALTPQPSQLGEFESGKKKRIKRRGRRPRHLVKQEPGGSGYDPRVKFLPPGTILSYLHLCQADLPHLRIGRKLFCRATWFEWEVFPHIVPAHSKQLTIINHFRVNNGIGHNVSPGRLY